MKKIIFTLMCVFCATFGYPSSIKMVSYFPIPYVSYSDLRVSNTCDVGLLNTCQLDMDALYLQTTTDTTPNSNLNTGSLYVKRGDFNILAYPSTDSIMRGSRLGIGKHNQQSAMWFDSARFTVTGKFLDSSTLGSLVTTNLAVIKGLSLRGANDAALGFPVCNADNNEINWAHLTIDGRAGVYLICGQKAGIKTCDPATKPTFTQTCNECGVQSKAVVCNPNTGNWEASGDWGQCSVQNKVVCNCSSHPYDLGLGMWIGGDRETSYCCDGNVLYNPSGIVWEQSSSGLCCPGNVDDTNATQHDDGSWSGLVCGKSGGNNNSGGSGGSFRSDVILCTTPKNCSGLGCPSGCSVISYTEYKADDSAGQYCYYDVAYSC